MRIDDPDVENMSPVELSKLFDEQASMAAEAPGCDGTYVTIEELVLREAFVCPEKIKIPANTPTMAGVAFNQDAGKFTVQCGGIVFEYFGVNDPIMIDVTRDDHGTICILSMKHASRRGTDPESVSFKGLKEFEDAAAKARTPGTIDTSLHPIKLASGIEIFDYMTKGMVVVIGKASNLTVSPVGNNKSLIKIGNVEMVCSRAVNTLLSRHCRTTDIRDAQSAVRGGTAKAITPK